MATATEHITLTAPDISCGHCVMTVQNTLRDLGVEDAPASAATTRIDVTFDPARASPDRIEAALDDAGYPVQG
jgi:copper chaperone CopZ